MTDEIPYPTDPARILRDLAEGWYQAATKGGISADQRVECLRMAKGFAAWARAEAAKQ